MKGDFDSLLLDIGRGSRRKLVLCEGEGIEILNFDASRDTEDLPGFIAHEPRASARRNSPRTGISRAILAAEITHMFTALLSDAK